MPPTLPLHSCDRLVRNQFGKALAGVELYVYERGEDGSKTTTPATGLYADETGTVAASQPLVSTSEGSFEVWAERGRSFWTHCPVDVVLPWREWTTPPGLIGFDGLAASVAADLDLAFSRWSPVPLSQVGGGTGFGSGVAGDSLALLTQGGNTTAATDGSAAAIIPFDPASYAAGDRDVYLRIICSAVTNNTAPGRNIAFTLRPLSSIDSTTGGPRATPSATKVPGAERIITSASLPLRTWTGLQVYSDPFVAPAAGGYILCASPVGGSIAAGAIVICRAGLEVAEY